MEHGQNDSHEKNMNNERLNKLLKYESEYTILIFILGRKLKNTKTRHFERSHEEMGYLYSSLLGSKRWSSEVPLFLPCS